MCASSDAQFSWWLFPLFSKIPYQRYRFLSISKSFCRTWCSPSWFLDSVQFLFLSSPSGYIRCHGFVYLSVTPLFPVEDHSRIYLYMHCSLRCISRYLLRSVCSVRAACIVRSNYFQHLFYRHHRWTGNCQSAHVFPSCHDFGLSNIHAQVFPFKIFFSICQLSPRLILSLCN